MDRQMCFDFVDEFHQSVVEDLESVRIEVGRLLVELPNRPLEPKVITNERCSNSVSE